jgi:hypothetical protein
MPNIKSTWVISPSMTQVPGIIPVSPLWLWCCEHHKREVHDTCTYKRPKINTKEKDIYQV